MVLFGLAWFVVVAIAFSHNMSRAREWPLIYCLFLVIIEAWLYWYIKGRNTQRDASLLHILLLMLALASLFLRDGIWLWQAAAHPHRYRLRGMRTITRMEYTLFGGLLIIAHLFFFRVLRAAFANQPETTLPS